jgi:hypothetical protein
MYNFDDILIIGDSFCASRHLPESWCQIVTNTLSNTEFNVNKIPRGYGYQGSSWWSTRKRLLIEFEKSTPKIVILFHTQPSRLPANDDLGLNYASAKEFKLWDPLYNEIKLDRKRADAVVAYYEHLYVDDFHKWCTKHWQIELDDILISYPSIEKIVHFYCFDDDYNSYVFNRGVTVLPPLIEYADFSYQTKPESAKWETINHFTVERNQIFAKSLLNLIENYPGDGIQVNKKMA